VAKNSRQSKYTYTMNAAQHRRYCRCRRYCPRGNIVSYRTFARHRRQEQLDREQSDGTNTDDTHSGDSSDADDESSDSDDENSDSYGRSAGSLEPLFPMALPEQSPELSERGSADRREWRTASPFNSPSTRASSSAMLSTERDSEHIDAAQTSLPPEPAPTVDDMLDDPPAASPLGTSPPPSTSEEGLAFEDIEEAIFSTFDIEDLLFASQIEVQPWLRLGIVLLRWKSRKNISTHAFDELRHELAQCIGMKVPSSSVIVGHLQQIVGFYPRKIHCCSNGCLAYVGRYRRATKCATWGQLRYQVGLPSDDDVPDLNMKDSDLSDEEIEDESQVRV
jgi:hypothetical protein